MRTTPYTVLGIRRLKCCRCGSPARTQWQVCSDGNQYRPLCLDCDFALNKMVMDWMGLPFSAADYTRQIREQHEEQWAS